MNRRVIASIFTLQAVFAVGLVAVNLSLNQAPSPPPKVLAETTVHTQKPKVDVEDVNRATPTPDPVLAALVETRIQKIDEQTKTAKDSYLIAFYGDSMIETMGGGLPYVYKELKAKYPQTDFVLYNYGIGAENVVEAISRFSLPYSYKDREFEPIDALKPDIIVLGSYAYNPLTPFDKNESWLLLAELVTKAKATGAEVYILAEQAPIKEGFATGVGGVNWPPEISDPHVEKILQGLKNAVGLAPSLGVGLINIYEQSLAENSSYGKTDLVAKHDGIHYSEEGQEFSAKVIVESISLE